MHIYRDLWQKKTRHKRCPFARQVSIVRKKSLESTGISLPEEFNGPLCKVGLPASISQLFSDFRAHNLDLFPIQSQTVVLPGELLQIMAPYVFFETVKVQRKNN